MFHERDKQQQEKENEQRLSDGEDDKFRRCQLQPPFVGSMADNFLDHGNAHGAQNRK